MDTIKIAAASTADLVDRQFALLVDEAHNMGMPETLVPYGGLRREGAADDMQRPRPRKPSSGRLSDTVLSRSTECANQDKVSMGLQAALSASEIVRCRRARSPPR